MMMTKIPKTPRQDSMRLSCLGEPARRVLSRAGAARLIGITSRGWFLLAGDNTVLFLTALPHRGPLTLNLPGRLPGAQAFQSGEPVTIQDEAIWFPGQRLSILTGGVDAWQPGPPALDILPPAERQAALRCLQMRQPKLPTPIHSIELLDLAGALGSGSAQRAAFLLAAMLGRGTGLTPQGDDVVIGLLLALNRWRARFSPELELGILNQQAVLSARSRTTSLSASLIACAAEGQADERLIRALDGLVTGSPAADECAALFQDWGSTSGWAAFQGMALALGAA